ncbi:His-Xaa-Ser system radical SAM maturase HxsC [Aestuariivirga sp.]|uniref:His-Xaa-Ser system radical SAM maturase HxsC n=1 Tax=Aestuariivirga sp. TaxID=2650926 RepID=UPI0039E3367C
MIPLRLRATSHNSDPFVVRLFRDWHPELTGDDAYLVSCDESCLSFASGRGDFVLHGVQAGDVDGDVVLVVPKGGTAQRLIRANSRHNTILITERCDQTCVMCSQPPKAKHFDWFEYFKAAVRLAPLGCTIGLSGGEPTLYKAQLFDLLATAVNERPDLSFHILSNGQHFDKGDFSFFDALEPRAVTWGIPLYSHLPETHDKIVAKQGAYNKLLDSFGILFQVGAAIELRTVITQWNSQEFDELARFVCANLAFISQWSIMQLEPIGYGRQNWEQLFFDHSKEFSMIAKAVDIARAAGLCVRLFNFPLCTVPHEYRELAPATISDWKQKFLPECAPCGLRESCTGFFEWYKHDKGFGRISAQ